MADKQKIRNYACELLKDSQNGFGSASYNMLKMVIAYIDSIPEEPVSEDLGEYINELSKQFPEVSFAKLSRIAVRVAKWQKEQFEKDYTDLCNGIATAKGIAVAMAYDKGVADAKEHIIKDATDVTVHVDAGGYPYIPQMELYDYDKDIPLAKAGDKYKVVLIRED